MARRAGRAGEVLLAGAPRGGIEIQVLAIRVVEDAVLGFVPDLDLGVIRAEVALAARLGLACLSGAELVTGVAGGTGAPGAVRIHPAHAGVGPGVGSGPAAGVDFYLGTVALPAGGVHCRLTAHHLAEQVVERAEDLPSLGVVRALLLVELLVMAAGAVLGRDNHRDGEPFVLPRIDIVGIGLMAGIAVDVVLAVLGLLPLGDDPLGDEAVALDAPLALG